MLRDLAILGPMTASDGTPTDCAITIHSVTDGDTVRLFRRWEVSRVPFPAGALVMDEIRELYDDPQRAPAGLAARLCYVDTPERGQPGYKEATADLAHWLMDNARDLRGLIYEHGGFDRLLVDLYAAGDVHNTASQWMLRYGNGGKGWLPYVRGQ